MFFLQLLCLVKIVFQVVFHTVITFENVPGEISVICAVLCTEAPAIRFSVLATVETELRQDMHLLYSRIHVF